MVSLVLFFQNCSILAKDNFLNIRAYFLSNWRLLFTFGPLFIPCYTDVDECASPESNECDPNALCTNTDGSYVCRCLRGFKGNGKTCTGKIQVAYLPLRAINLKNSNERHINGTATF